MTAGVELRAFRGTRRASVYRSHVLAVDAVARIAAVAERTRMPVLASLRSPPRELDKAAAARLAAEVTALRTGAELLELDAELTAVAEVARWCARAREHAWLELSQSGV